MVSERRICLDKVEKKILNFFGWLQASGWICFIEEPIRANHTIVAQFHANASETNFGVVMATMIRGVRVNFILATINAIYGLTDTDNKVYRERF